MSDIWNTVKSWFTKNAEHYTYIEFPDPAATVTSVVPYQHYFRVWLTDMFLTKGRNWFVDLYPAVNAQVRLAFAGQSGVTFSQMAAPPKDALAPGVFQNYPLSPLIPFPGGIVEVQSSLLALQGASGWATAVKVLETFSGLVAPPLGQSLTLASKVTDAIGTFMGDVNGRVHLGLHQAYSAQGGGGANKFKTGYAAVILAPAAKYPPGQLTVVADRLHTSAGGQTKPLDGVDYMLFRIEARAERDDWQLPNINEPWERARVAFATNKPAEGREQKALAIGAAFMSSDLTKPDQLRVAKAIKEDLAEIEALGQGAVLPLAADGQPEKPQLKPLMEHKALTWDQARVTPRPTLEEMIQG